MNRHFLRFFPLPSSGGFSKPGSGAFCFRFAANEASAISSSPTSASSLLFARFIAFLARLRSLNSLCKASTSGFAPPNENRPTPSHGIGTSVLSSLRIIGRLIFARFFANTAGSGRSSAIFLLAPAIVSTARSRSRARCMNFNHKILDEYPAPAGVDTVDASVGVGVALITVSISPPRAPPSTARAHGVARAPPSPARSQRYRF